MKSAPFTLIERDALGRVVRVQPLMFVPVRALPVAQSVAGRASA